MNKQNGINNLGIVLKNEMNKMFERPLVLDFGVISEDYSLKTNTFPIAIPVNDYSVCVRGLKKNDRVLVAWVGVDAVVVNTVISAEEVFENG